MVKSRKVYIPDQGDIVFLTFDPAAGHEQKKRRPALVVSHQDFNHKTGMALVCPITSSAKSFMLRQTLPGGLNTKGQVMTEQVKSLDWKERKAELIERVPVLCVREVVAKLIAVIDGDC